LATSNSQANPIQMKINLNPLKNVEYVLQPTNH